MKNNQILDAIEYALSTVPGISPSILVNHGQLPDLDIQKVEFREESDYPYKIWYNTVFYSMATKEELIEINQYDRISRWIRRQNKKEPKE